VLSPLGICFSATVFRGEDVERGGNRLGREEELGGEREI